MKQFVFSVSYSGYVRGRNYFIVDAETLEEAKMLTEEKGAWYEEAWREEARNDTELDTDGEGARNDTELDTDGEGARFEHVQVENSEGPEDSNPVAGRLTMEHYPPAAPKCNGNCNCTPENCQK